MAAEVVAGMDFDPNETDRRILAVLEAGEVAPTPKHIGEELDYTRQHIYNRLQLLAAAGYVENLGSGVYRIIDQPLDDQ